MLAPARTHLAVALALTAALGCHRLKAERAKSLPQPTLEIRVEVPGQRPSDVETTVSIPVVRAVAAAGHIARVRATSEYGRSTVTVELYPGTDPGTEIPALRERLQATVALLPANASTPVLVRKDGPLVGRFVLSKDFTEPARLEWLNRTEGVGAVTTCGNAAGDVTLDLNVDALALEGITVADVATLLASLHPLSSPGLPQVVLGYHNGAPVRLSDVATMTDGGSASGCSAFDDQGTPLYEAEVFALPSVTAAQVRANLTEASRKAWLERPITEARSLGPGRIVSVAFAPTATFPAIAKTIGAATKGAEPGVSFILEVEAPGGADAAPTSGRVVLESNDEAIVRRVTAALMTMPQVAAAGEANATVELVSGDRATLAPAAAELCRRLRERGLLVACPGVTPLTMSVPEVDHALAQRLHVSMSDLTLTLDAFRGRLRFPLAVVYATNASLRLRVLASLDHLYVKTPSGEQVPVSALVKLKTESSPSLLQLENGRPFASAHVRTTDLSALKNVYQPPPGIELRVIPD